MRKRFRRMVAKRPDPNRPPPLKVLHVASEMAPFSKTGSVGDVLGALPRALSDHGLLVDVLTPLYGSIDLAANALGQRLTPVEVSLGGETHAITIHEGKAAGRVRAFFAALPQALQRQHPAPADELDPDDPLRFALLARAALGLEQALNRRYDVIQCHDWQAALVAATRSDIPVVLTIHNLGAQGLCDPAWIERLELPRDRFDADGYAVGDDVSLLKAGIRGANVVTTVSPRYADEAREEEHGFGLASALRARGEDFIGILNGADYALWDPSTDRTIAAPFDATDIAPKRRCKAALLRAFRLPVRSEDPLIGCVGRLTEQKGYDLVADALPQIIERGARVVLLGSGDSALEERFRDAAKQWPDRVGVRIARDDNLAHQITAGSDFFLMPSRWEPCGLNQLYALRYGSVPIGHAVGGLMNTIERYDPEADAGTGFLFEPDTVPAMIEALDRALAVYREPARWRALQRRGMSRDFSWKRSGRHYLAIYAHLTDRPDLAEEEDDAPEPGEDEPIRAV